ncbi:MAG: RNA 2'-phosphotransferase [Gemmataceae bacterium]
MSKRLVTVSKYLSKYLRHDPAGLGLTLRPGGWVPIADLLAAAEANGFRISADELREVVHTSDKQRFAMDDTGTLIRANQGHSVEVDLHLEPATPPAVLYHGTGRQNRDAILAGGLLKMRRHHVHLSADVATAVRVGQRHGVPLVFVVAAGRMAADGVAFYVSQNGVWLTDHVAPAYLSESEAP